MFNWPFHPPSSGPAGWAVFLWAFVILLIAAGLGGLVVSFSASPDKRELAEQLTHYSLWSIGIGLLIATVTWIARRVLD